MNGLLFWKRFVDDTFTIIKKDANVDNIIDILNSFHNCIVFTHEEEVNNSVPFLDIYITRVPNNILTIDLTNNSTNTSNKELTNNLNNKSSMESINSSNNKLSINLNSISNNKSSIN